MDSDDYFDGDEFDSAILNEVDRIVEAQLRPKQPPKAKDVIEISSDGFDDSLVLDDKELERLDNFINDVYAGKIAPTPGPSKLTRQTTLTGEILQSSPRKSQKNTSLQSSKSNSGFLGAPPKKAKTWDHTAFTKPGQRKSTTKSQGKKRALPDSECEDDERDEELVEFEQFPSPFIQAGPPPPMKLKPDLLAAKEWIYPLNRPRRDYQLNISKRCLFDNTLVALPTGLGKTFIAGVVMLNFYRWFPEGKVVFLAPTKPLVAQQIEASHQVCGIPGSKAIELTGDVPRKKRLSAWSDKRVFYMTPQTLYNDLISGVCDAQDIILIVIDEAHKGTGDYSYAKVVRHMMYKNPHFRVLALTATPGNNAEAVQEIVDSLHISHIEIRNEDSLDLREFVFKKEVITHIIKMTPAVNKIRVILSKLIKDRYNRISKTNLIQCHNIPNIHPYQCTQAMQRLSAMKDKSMSWAYAPLRALSVFSRALAYLTESSMSMCYACLKDFEVEEKKKQRSTIVKEQDFVELISLLDDQQLKGFEIHPKMVMVKELILKHLLSSPPVGGSQELSPDTPTKSKIMVFIQYRDCVDEAVGFLNRESPRINASRFIGQGTDKQGRKGINQSEQIEVIRKFKEGEFNVLVSTSIGEEGLDIGEIDRIICYDSSKSAIRMLQRVGRTGRRRKGYVDVLLAEDREERNWAKSKENYEDVQQCIIRGSDIELYSDVERLIPEHIKPELLGMKMPIEEYTREEKSSKTTPPSPEKSKKRKRKEDPGRNVPVGAITGFLAASKLRVKEKDPDSKGKRPRVWRPLSNDDLEDELDKQIANDLDFTQSASPPSKVVTGSKTTSRKGARTTNKPKGKGINKGTKTTENVSQESIRGTSKGASAPSNYLLPDEALSAPPSMSFGSNKTHKLGCQMTSETISSRNWLLDQESDEDVFAVGTPQQLIAPTSPFSTARHLAEAISDEDIGLISIPNQSPSPARKAFQAGSINIVQPLDSNETGSSSPIRRVRGRPKASKVESSSDGDNSPRDSHLRRIGTRARPKRSKLGINHNPLFDVEAQHSGDEVSEGHSDVDMVENESDREFLRPLDPTQASPSYNQDAAYRFGLMTQVPHGGPVFASKPVRTGPFAGGITKPRRPILVSSSPNRDEPNEYAMDSFVVDDDEPIVFDQASSDL